MMYKPLIEYIRKTPGLVSVLFTIFAAHFAFFHCIDFVSNLPFMSEDFQTTIWSTDHKSKLSQFATNCQLFMALAILTGGLWTVLLNPKRAMLLGMLMSAIAFWLQATPLWNLINPQSMFYLTTTLMILGCGFSIPASIALLKTVHTNTRKQTTIHLSITLFIGTLLLSPAVIQATFYLEHLLVSPIMAAGIVMLVGIAILLFSKKSWETTSTPIHEPTHLNSLNYSVSPLIVILFIIFLQLFYQLTDKLYYVNASLTFFGFNLVHLILIFIGIPLYFAKFHRNGAFSHQQGFSAILLGWGALAIIGYPIIELPFMALTVAGYYLLKVGLLEVIIRRVSVKSAAVLYGFIFGFVILFTYLYALMTLINLQEVFFKNLSNIASHGYLVPAIIAFVVVCAGFMVLRNSRYTTT